MKKYLFSSNGQYIASLVDGYMYNTSGKNIARYIDSEGVFADRNGKYFGEIFGEYRLLRKISLAQQDTDFGAYEGEDIAAGDDVPGDYGKIGDIAGFEDIPQQALDA